MFPASAGGFLSAVPLGKSTPILKGVFNEAVFLDGQLFSLNALKTSFHCLWPLWLLLGRQLPVFQSNLFFHPWLYVRDGWMASLPRWTCVWVNSGSLWWTGRPGVLRFMGSQRVGHDWVTELNWYLRCFLCLNLAKFHCDVSGSGFLFRLYFTEPFESVIVHLFCKILSDSLKILLLPHSLFSTWDLKWIHVGLYPLYISICSLYLFWYFLSLKYFG